MKDVRDELPPGSSAQMNRRRMLRLMGAGTVGAAGLSLLAACGVARDGEPIDVVGGATPTPQPTLAPGTQRALTPYYLGYNNVPHHSPPFGNSQALETIKKFNPGTLRYPGGTIANFWDWQSGWIIPGQKEGWGAMSSRIDLGDLKAGVEGTGAQPVYVLNVMTDGLESQLTMLRTARDMNLPVKFIELGNEFFLEEYDYATYFPMGSDYGRAMRPWIDAIRKEFPDAQIGIVGGTPGSSKNIRRYSWTKDALAVVPDVDAVALHPYVPLSEIRINVKEPLASLKVLDSAVVGKWAEYENHIQDVAPDKKIWLTEYNLVDKRNNNDKFTVFRTWIHGIYVAKMSLLFLDQPNVEILSFFDLIGQTGNELAFYAPQPRAVDPEIAPYGLTAAGMTMLPLGEAMKGATSAEKITFGGGGTSDLLGWIFRGGPTAGQAYIINSGPDSYNWTVPQLFAQAQYQQWSHAEAFQEVDDQNQPASQNGKLEGQLPLPGFSITRIIIG